MNADIDISNVVLIGERIILRFWNENDLDDFYEYASVDGVGQMAGWLPHKSKSDSARVLNDFIQGKKTFAIVYKVNNKVIGSLGIEPYKNVDKLTEFKDYKGRELGFVLSKDYWGQGIMPEAVNLVIDYCFNILDLDFLLCGHFDYNTRSARVQEKCGFTAYRKIYFGTHYGTQEAGILSLLSNPKKNIVYNFSHKETLIIS